MRIRLGCRFTLALTQPTPMIALLNVHYTRAADLEYPDHIVTVPAVPLTGYRDSFGNWCTRLVAPPGTVVIGTDAVIRDSGLPDPVAPGAGQATVESLPAEVMVYLLGSRYCDTDLLSETAWSLFKDTPLGWARVQAISDFVHNHIRFGYENAVATRSASQAYAQGVGVCRDYTHLAIAFCRCMNIPARYCTGYLGDIGMAPPYPPGDFSAWMEVFLDGQWWVFDPRNNQPRIGRVLVARGRDAADVPMLHSFGVNQLTDFRVWTDQID
jgi:transglutaminase-like putative cysteine protease